MARANPPYEILDVSFAAVAEFFGTYDFSDYGSLLMIGVAPRSQVMRLETVARNWCGDTPDVRGEIRGPCPIDPMAPFQLSATLWRPEWLEGRSGSWEASSDAGDYLCNYALFRALQKLPHVQVGFLHIPLPTALTMETQMKVVSEFRLQLECVAR